MVYLAVILAVAVSLFLSRSRAGLYLRAVGENPATADAAGINVTRYKYLATCIGGMIAGLGGLFYIMDYSNGIWSNNGFGDRGWLAIAIVIFATWKPTMAILGSYLFGALYILFNYLNVPMRLLPLPRHYHRAGGGQYPQKAGKPAPRQPRPFLLPRRALNQPEKNSPDHLRPGKVFIWITGFNLSLKVGSSCWRKHTVSLQLIGDV